MKSDKPKAESARHSLSVPAAAKLIGIGKKTFCYTLRGEIQFKQSKIRKLKEILYLSNERVSDIFLPI